jgi:hypothetical protein
VHPPVIVFGQRFRVSSRSGTRYVARFLGGADGGIFVRLDDQRIARLDQSRLQWSTFEPASNDGELVVRAGDEVIVELGAARARGRLETLRPLAVRTRLEVIPIPREQVRALFLLFRARELVTGDRFIVRGLSGTEYEGLVRALDAERVTAVLRDGRETLLQRRKLDLSTLLVLIPVPLDRL